MPSQKPVIAKQFMKDKYKGESTPYLDKLKKEKKKYKVRIDHGVLYRNVDRASLQNGVLLDGQYLYAVSPRGGLYMLRNSRPPEIVGKRHSTFFAGSPVLCAGIMHVQAGQIVYMDNQSGHYKPPQENLILAALHLCTHGFLRSDVCNITDHREELGGRMDLNAHVSSRLPQGITAVPEADHRVRKPPLAGYVFTELDKDSIITVLNQCINTLDSKIDYSAKNKRSELEAIKAQIVDAFSRGHKINDLLMNFANKANEYRWFKPSGGATASYKKFKEELLAIKQGIEEPSVELKPYVSSLLSKK